MGHIQWWQHLHTSTGWNRVDQQQTSDAYWDLTFSNQAVLLKYSFSMLVLPHRYSARNQSHWEKYVLLKNRKHLTYYCICGQMPSVVFTVSACQGYAAKWRSFCEYENSYLIITISIHFIYNSICTIISYLSIKNHTVLLLHLQSTPVTDEGEHRVSLCLFYMDTDFSVLNSSMSLSSELTPWYMVQGLPKQ